MAVSTAQKKKKNGEGEGPDPEFWMVTFGDLLSLLITFFVLLFSMSSLDDQVLEDAFFSAFVGGAGALSFGGGAAVERPKPPPPPFQRPVGLREFFEYLLEQELADKKALLASVTELDESLLAHDVKIKNRGGKFVMTFPSEQMFAVGSAALKEDVKRTLDNLGNVLQYSESDIVIEGHTDDVPISTAMYASNWELSAARASNVMMYLVDRTPLKPDKIQAVGYADTKPVVKNISESYRARNRRVEIVVRQALAI